MESFLTQIIDKPFKPSNYSIYSILEDDGFIMELEKAFGQKYTVDDLEYIVFTLEEKEKNALLYRMSDMTKRIRELRKIIEIEIQEDSNKKKSIIYVDRDKRYMFIAKLKEFNLKERLAERIEKEKGEKENSKSPVK